MGKASNETNRWLIHEKGGTVFRSSFSAVPKPERRSGDLPHQFPNGSLHKGVVVNVRDGKLSLHLVRLGGPEVPQHIGEGIGVVVVLELRSGGEDHIRQLGGKLIGGLLGVGGGVCQ